MSEPRQLMAVAYAGTTPTQTLDLYLPEDTEAPFPVIVAVHGGAFFEGNSAGEDVFPMLAGVRRGYAVASVNYRLSGEARFPAAVNDVKAAIRFVRSNSGRYSLDPDRIAVWGTSAGGNLASVAGTTSGTDTLYDSSLGHRDVSDAVTAVVDWFGPVSFLDIDAQFETLGVTSEVGPRSSASSPESRYLGQPITKVPEVVARANPMSYAGADAPPFLIQHGTADVVIPYLQSTDFHDCLTATSIATESEIVLLDGEGHGTPGFGSEENLEVVYRFLDRYMKTNGDS